MNSDYVLNFTIPQGPTGPTGPSNPAIKAYGYIMNLNADYSQRTINWTFSQNSLPTAVQLPRSASKLNVDNPLYAIEILNEGVYEIKYSILLKAAATSTNPVNVTMAIANESYTPEPISFLTIPLQDDAFHLFSYSIIINVGNGGESQIGTKNLVIFADQTVDFTYTSAYLSVNKIGDI